MTTVSKDQSQAVDEMITAYTAVEQNETADTSPGTVNRDVIDAVADLVSIGFDDIAATQLDASLKNVALVSADALSLTGLSFDLARLSSTKATGIVYFQKNTAPTYNVDFPVGTVVQTQKASDGSVTKFVTLAAASLTPTTAFNPENRKYEVSALVVAVEAGSDGNVGPGSLNTLATANRNIDSVTNKEATSGGTDLEDASGYATRILAKTAGSTLGTVGGYVAAIEEMFPSLVDVAIAGPGDAAMVRAQFGNEADVYLVGSSFAAFTDIITVAGTGSDLLTTHPVFSLASVVGSTTGTNYPVGTDVELTRDEGPVFGGSTKALDKITWLTAHRAGASQQVTVVGLYDANVAEVQDYLDREDVRYITLDILAKAGNRVGVVVETSVVSRSGFDRTTLESAIETAVIDGLTNYKLGQSVFQSSLVDIIGSVNGVDEVTIPFTELRKSTEAPGTVSDVIAIDTSEYARIDSVTITAS